MATPETPTQQGGGTPGLSYDEWKAQLAQSMGQQEEGPNPSLSFWQRLLHGAPGTSRWNEIGRSVARGAANFANETANSLSIGATALGKVAKATITGELTSEDIAAPAKDRRIVPKEAIDQVYGKRSDDPLAAFVEGATQFTAGFALTAPLALEATAAKLGLSGVKAIVAGGAARGAIVDATAFDPREAGLAELAARAPVPVVKQLGEVLSVKGDDTEAVARLKRGAAGVVPAVILDGLIAGVRYLRAARVGDTAAMDIEAKVVNAVAKGEHAPPDAHVVARPEPDETWTIQANSKSKDMTGFAEEKSGLKFADRAEAEMQAETINQAINQRVAATKRILSKGDVDNVREIYSKLLKGEGTKEEQAAFADALQNGTHFNFSYYHEPKEVLSAIESISQTFKEEIDAAQKVGGVTIEQHYKMMQDLLGGLPPEIDKGEYLAQMIDMGGSQIPRSVLESAADLMMRRSARQVSNLFDVTSARPHDAVAFEEMKNAVSSMLRLQKTLAEAESEWGRTGRFKQEKDTFAKADATGTVPKSQQAVKEAPPLPLPDVAGMTRRDVEVIARMVKMTNGEPRNLFAVARGARVIKETGILRKGLEVFANSLLSGMATPTSLMMNSVESVFRAGSKMLAGAFTANKAMFREGADILYANERFVVDNIKAAASAFKAGRSIINPQDTHIAIEGAVGDIVRIPSRALLFADEFTRVSNYRSFVRARSLRYWRERGLEGSQLYSSVEQDLRSAFDARTGMATIPEALNYAEGPTMSAALGKETLGGKLSDFLNSSVEARFVAPFVKTSINVFRTTWDRTPMLNLFSKRAAPILMGREGKEAAANLWAQTSLAGSLYVYGYLKAKAGEVTGRGPADPQLRKLWMQDHQPYSIKVGGEWISYRRGDPLFAPLGIVADLSQIIEDVDSAGHGQTDAGDVATAFVAALAASFSNKTYMQGVTQFFDAWSSGEKNKMTRWMYGLGTGFIPQGVALANTDHYLREVESFKDAVMAKIPGLSDKLPARYNLFGEPIYRQPSLQVFPSKGSAEETVATTLLALGKGFAPLSRTAAEGRIDLTDRDRFHNKEGLSPYERMQELLRQPPHGKPPLKDALTDLVKTDKWKRAEPGSEQYPGGQRWQLAAHVIDGYQRRAYTQVLHEYPDLKDALHSERRVKMVSRRDGQEGVDQLLGTLRK